MYDSVTELPVQVKAALDEAGQICWMKSYNHHLEQSKDPVYSSKMAWHFVAKKDDSRAISGVLSRDVVDDQRERLNQDVLFKEFSDMISNYGAPIHDAHSNRPAGLWYDAVLEEVDGIKQLRAYGMVNKGKPFYDAFWETVVSKKANALSVAIMKHDVQFKCDATKCWKQVNDMGVFEGSIVGKGSCPGTKLDSINYSAKESQLEKGVKVELEHGTIHPETNITNDDPVMTEKIAKAHLNEIPDYYTRLSIMESEAKMENKSTPSEGDTIAQLPAAPKVEEKCSDGQAALANKDTLGLGDAGVEALQKILMLQAETNKRLADLDAKLSSHITAEESSNNETGEQPVGEKAPPGEKPGDKPNDKEPDKDGDDQKKKPKAEVQNSNKSTAIVPPMAPTNPASPDDIHPSGMTESADADAQKKKAEAEAVAALQERKKMAEKEGATTPRPESAAQDQGASPKVDALTALLGDQDKLRHMSALDIEKFVSKYAKGEI